MIIPAYTLDRLDVGILEKIDTAVATVARRGRFILGEETEAFENELGAYYDATATTVGSGTDALIAALLACGVGPAQEVILPAMTASATAIAVREVGAVPVVVDIREGDLLLDPSTVLEAITPRTAAVIPVHLYGQVQDLSNLVRACDGAGVSVIEDACQSMGAGEFGRRVQGRALGTSFYPTKNLGSWGDGGAVVTNESEVTAFVRRWRRYGERERYVSEGPGRNSRLSEIQAAILRCKLPTLPNLVAERRVLADRYDSQLSSLYPLVGSPRGGASDALHLLPVRVPNRTPLRGRLTQQGVETNVHYPVPAHRHPGIAVRCPTGAPIAARAANELLSLPLFPGMREEEVDRVVEELRSASER